MVDNLYLALATDQNNDLDEVVRSAFYLVLAESEDQAAAIIRRTRLSNSVIEFKHHKLPVSEATDFFKLRRGSAHLLIAPPPEEPAKADYLFGERALENQEDKAVLDIMRGDPERLSLLRRHLSANESEQLEVDFGGNRPSVISLRSVKK